MDVAEGLHFAGSKKPPEWKTISNVECACGCGTLLTQKTVDRGWTVIRGHKAAMSGVLHNKPQQAIASHPRPKTLTVVNVESTLNFLEADLELTRTQMKEAQAEADRQTAKIHQLEQREKLLLDAQKAMKGLQ